MKISLKRKEEIVEIEDEHGHSTMYLIRELTGEQRDKYLNFTNSKMKTDLDGNPNGLKSVDGLYEQLLTLCLYDPSGKNVPAGTIKLWPTTAQSVLFKKAQDLSGLGQEVKVDEVVINEPV